MAEPTHSPYNFVPLPKGAPERRPYPGIDRIAEDSYGGVLQCDLEVIHRLFTADQRGDRGKVLPFLRNSAGEPILQATTLKGMIRAVYEAAFPSCLPLAAARRVSKRRGKDVAYSVTVPVDHQQAACRNVETLCPACRLFGIAQGDEVHAQGRVLVSDAVLSSGRLESKEVKLAELSSPKPHHYPIYSATGGEGGEVSGRKLYYHHDPEIQPAVEKLGARSSAIREFAPPGTCFSFEVRLVNLSREEMKRFIACLVLDDRHAHKLGMAKPLGYGSCRITILARRSSVYQGGGRYRRWDREDERAFEASTWALGKAWLTGRLGDLLRLDRESAGPIGYRSLGGYRGMGLDEQGRYGVAEGAGARRQAGATSVPEPKPPTEPLTSALPSALPETPKPERKRRRGDRAALEVVSHEGNRYRLRDPETGQEDIRHLGTGLPWQVGQRVKVRIVAVTAEGKIKTIAS